MTHKGYSIAYLLNRLVGRAHASRILAKYGLSDKPTLRVVEEENGARPLELVWPEGIYAYDPQFDHAVARYLVTRGFKEEDVNGVCERWQLRVGRHGTYAGRLIIPYLLGGAAVHFTGRAMGPAVLRYKANPTSCAVVDPSDLIFNADDVVAPAGVVLVEGQLDAIKATTYGPLPAVAMSTNSLSRNQLQVLTRARRVIIMVDNDHLKTSASGDITAAALTIYAQLIRAGVAALIQPIPRGYKDLAEIPATAYSALLSPEILLQSRVNSI